MGTNSAGPEHPDSRAHVVMLVGNEVTPDTRVKKMAVSLSNAGLRVTVVGITHGQAPLESTIAGARILRVPFKRAISQAPKRSRALGPNAKERYVAAGLEFALKKYEALAAIGRLSRQRLEAKDRHRRRVEQMQQRLPRLPRVVVRYVLQLLWRIVGPTYKTRIKIHKARLYIARRRRDRLAPRAGPRPGMRSKAAQTATQAIAPTRVRWRSTLPVLHDFELVMAPVIDSLDADVIHAHDMHMIGIGERAASRARARGRTVHFVYDAHEYVRGVDRHMPAIKHSAYVDLENEYIRSADQIITVSEPLADRLVSDHGLDQRPAVVMNVPIITKHETDAQPTSIRVAAGVADDDTLVVYSGRIHASRDVHTLVEALAYVPDIHLALVSNVDGEYIESLQQRARDGGYSNRLHILPYVSPDQVVDFVASADIGVNLLTPCANHEVALPNKFFEYLYAGLPILNSDVGATAELVRAHDLGQVFLPEDPRSCAQAIEKLVPIAPSIRQRLQEGPEFLREFTWQAQERRLVEVYQGLLGEDALAVPDVQVVDLTERSTNERRFETSDADARLLIGPMNINAWAMAENLRVTFPRLHVEVLTRARGKNRLEFPADRRVEKASWKSLDWQLTQARHVLDNFTHVLSEGGMSVLGTFTGGHFVGDLPILDSHGLRLALWFHGSDIRDPRMHREYEKHSPFHGDGDGLTKTLEEQVSVVRTFVEAHPDIPRFVTTMDLLDYVPEAVWTPVAVELDRWPAGRPLFQRKVPVVGHVSTNAFMKGGQIVTAVCRELEQRGLIEFRAPTRIPPADMPAWLADLDVFIDGIVLGDYGAAAAQAMAAQRVVVGHIATRVRERLPENPPIVEATPDDLAQVITAIAGEADHYRLLAESGRTYVERYHSGAYAARQFAEFLGIVPIARGE